MGEGSQAFKRTKGHTKGGLSPFRDSKTLKSFKEIFSKCQVIIEHNVKVEVLRTMELFKKMRACGWLPLIFKDQSKMKKWGFSTPMSLGRTLGTTLFTRRSMVVPLR